MILRRSAAAASLVLLIASADGCKSTPRGEPVGTSSSARVAHATIAAVDPLPSWRSGATKTAIVDFVARVTTVGSHDLVAEDDRIAVFDNDGTLWQEKPLAELEFARQRLEELVKREPDLREKQPFKAALDHDAHYFEAEGVKALLPIVAVTFGGTTEEAFEAEARAFFRKAIHPSLGVPYTSLVYRPMIELLTYLRARGFAVYVCSGGDTTFMRSVTDRIYDVGPERVIGTSMKRTSHRAGGVVTLYREREVDSLNDKLEKPVNLQLHVGKRPLFAAGNVGNGGDVAMLEFSRGRKGPSFQMLVRHDDAEREFAYGDDDVVSLDAARADKFTVVSMKNDWADVFIERPKRVN